MRAVFHLVVADLKPDSGAKILLARAAWITSPRHEGSHEPVRVLLSGGEQSLLYRGAHEGLEGISGAYHVGDVFEPRTIVGVAHDDAVLRVEHHEPFRDRFQC